MDPDGEKSMPQQAYPSQSAYPPALQGTSPYPATAPPPYPVLQTNTAQVITMNVPPAHYATTVPVPPPMIIRQGPAMPNNYLPLSIIVCVMFCFVFGLIGIIKGNEVRSLWIVGDYDGAERASKAAKMWSLAGFITGAIIIITCIIIILV